jgi:hypothetical protein
MMHAFVLNGLACPLIIECLTYLPFTAICRLTEVAIGYGHAIQLYLNEITHITIDKCCTAVIPYLSHCHNLQSFTMIHHQLASTSMRDTDMQTLTVPGFHLMDSFAIVTSILTLRPPLTSIDLSCVIFRSHELAAILHILIRNPNSKYCLFVTVTYCFGV